MIFWTAVLGFCSAATGHAGRLGIQDLSGYGSKESEGQQKGEAHRGAML
jgi:hypothetical protein